MSELVYTGVGKPRYGQPCADVGLLRKITSVGIAWRPDRVRSKKDFTLSNANSVSAVELIAAARAAVPGLEDFGAPPLSPVFERMVQAMNQEGRLSERGATGRGQHIVHLLSNRLRLTNMLRRRPELATAPLGRPVVIVGLPRSGTTKMQRMLVRDEQFNSIMTWECLSPVPLSDDPDERQKRIQIGEGFCSAFKTYFPDFYAAHPIEAHEPEEDMVLMQHSFLTESLDAEMHVPGFVDWLRTQDHEPMYRQLSLLLRVLAEQHGKIGQPWLLKGTYHGICLDVLLKVFPDAKVVYFHRDPVETIASYASLVSKMRRMLSDEVDSREVGQELLRYWAWHQNKMLQVRDTLPKGAILDIDYPDILRNASMVAERIYAFAGLNLTSKARAAMLAWETQNAQHRHGKHDYAIADYGISAAQIKTACAVYRQRFIENQLK